MNIIEEQRKVLMIDDDGYFDKISEAIRNAGHSVELEVNISNALSVLKNPNNKYDAILLDLYLNGSDLPKDVKGIWQANKGMPSGWAFYEYILLQKYESLANQTMFISGMLSQFDDWVLINRGVEWAKIKGENRVVAKNDEEITEKILMFLKRCKKLT